MADTEYVENIMVNNCDWNEKTNLFFMIESNKFQDKYAKVEQKFLVHYKDFISRIEKEVDTPELKSEADILNQFWHSYLISRIHSDACEFHRYFLNTVWTLQQFDGKLNEEHAKITKENINETKKNEILHRKMRYLSDSLNFVNSTLECFENDALYIIEHYYMEMVTFFSSV